jgi:pimeloyl-ACP methyl ester carboxylesterase
VTVSVTPEEFVWGTFRLVDFVQASQVAVRGLRNRYRWPGFGAALVASLEELPGARDKRFARVPPGLKVAVTAVLKIDRIHEALKTDSVEAKLELFTVTEQTTLTTSRGQVVPLEFEVTAALASTLEGSDVYDMETKGFFLGDFKLLVAKRFEDGVFLMGPYRTGRIPVVLVHGTASSPARWAELVNEIQNDRELWGRYQIWLFTYNTGNPILYSGGLLTEGLRNIVRELDPQGNDKALHKMVVIGHSQGGLLTKLTVVNSGTAFWNNGFDVPIDELDVSPETRKTLERSMFYTRLPFVRRVIFVATPHGGSFVAGGFIGKAAGTFIKLPFTLLSPIQEVVMATLGHEAAKFSVKNIPKSTDNMNPRSPFIKTLSSLPIAPGVTAYSIIPVKNRQAPKAEWNDGVVDYSSAHISGVKTELIVDSDHSTQAEPETIEEIRRILLENLREP